MLDAVGDVAGAELLAEGSVDPGSEFSTQGTPFFENHKQGHVAGAVFIFQIHHQAVPDFGNAFHSGIDFGCADAHPAPVQGSVRSSENNDRAAWGYFDPVAVPPHTGVGFKITAAVTFIVAVAPEVNRHRGHGFENDHFAQLIDDGLPLVVEGFQFAAQHPTLNFACVHG